MVKTVVLKLEDWFHIVENSYHGLLALDTIYQTTWCHNPDDHNRKITSLAVTVK
jgi:hypothetical protein